MGLVGRGGPCRPVDVTVIVAVISVGERQIGFAAAMPRNRNVIPVTRETGKGDLGHPDTPDMGGGLWRAPQNG